MLDARGFAHFTSVDVYDNTPGGFLRLVLCVRMLQRTFLACLNSYEEQILDKNLSSDIFSTKSGIYRSMHDIFDSKPKRDLVGSVL